MSHSFVDAGSIPFKVVLVGESGVGKSSIVQRFVHDKFTGANQATIGAAYDSKIHEGVEFKLWDTSGMERFRSLTANYYHGANAVIAVYDITDRRSFDALSDSWIAEITKYTEGNDVLLVILGNKTDMEDVTRQVSTESGEAFARRVGAFSFFEVSAKEQTTDIEEVFLDFVEIAHRGHTQRQGVIEIENYPDPDDKEKEKRDTSSCC